MPAGGDGRSLEGLPTGLVTFCLTDIEGSTRCWDDHPDLMPAVIARHDRIIEELVAAHGGVVVQSQGEGDSTLSVFRRPRDAADAILDVQRALGAEAWPLPTPLLVRAALHTCEGDVRDGRYSGPGLNRAARVRALAKGGEVFLTGVTAALLADALPQDSALRDVGRHDLRGLSRPEHVWALEPEEGAMAPRTAAFASRRGAELPAPLSSMFGRDGDIGLVRSLLEEHRLVTVVGAGGAGKTRVAVAVARGLAEAGRNIVFVDLAPAAGDVGVVAAVLEQLGVDDPASVPLVDGGARAAEAAAGAGVDILLLDNCEHVVDGVARLVTQILRRSGAARVLATSQVTLGVDGEAVMPLGPLPPDAAVELFAARASSQDPTFALGDDAETVAAICHRLDRLPLAIELAAAHVRTLEPVEILQRVDDAFGLLARGSRAGPDRHRTLLAAVEWSVSLLSPAERLLLERLSVFSDGFTVRAAEAVCGGEGIRREDVEPLLADLVDRSFVVRRARGRRARLWLLETIRQYGWQRLNEVQPTRTGPTAREVSIRLAGEVWEVRSRDVVAAHLKDSKGLRYLAAIVRRTGEEVHVLDLVGTGGRGAASVGAVGADGLVAGEGEQAHDVIDAAARASYRRRLEDLAAELEVARARADDARVATLEEEFDTLAAHVEAATGLGGRVRQVPGTAERARMSVTKALRSAIARVADVDPEAGAHLDASVSTGTWCAYRPAGGTVSVVARP